MANFISRALLLIVKLSDTRHPSSTAQTPRSDFGSDTPAAAPLLTMAPKPAANQ